MTIFGCAAGCAFARFLCGWLALVRAGFGEAERRSQAKGDDYENNDNDVASAVIGSVRHACLCKLLLQFAVEHDAQRRFRALAYAGAAARDRRFAQCECTSSARTSVSEPKRNCGPAGGRRYGRGYLQQRFV